MRDQRMARMPTKLAALIALGVSGGIGAYKAVEVARGLQKRGHDVAAVMTRSARRFVGEVTFEAITRRRVDHDAVVAGRERRHRAHLARVRQRAAAGRAGDREHHRQVRRRHRRRLPERAVSGDARPGAARAGDEHQHAGARAVQANLADAGEPRRAVRRSRRRLSRVRLDRQGTARRAGGDRRSRRADSRRRRARCSAGWWSSPPARPTRTSTTCGISAIDRAAGWDMRWPPRRCAAARE